MSSIRQLYVYFNQAGGLNIKPQVHSFTYFQEINNVAVFLPIFSSKLLSKGTAEFSVYEWMERKQLSVRVGKLLILFFLVE